MSSSDATGDIKLVRNGELVVDKPSKPVVGAECKGFFLVLSEVPRCGRRSHASEVPSSGT